MWIMNLVNASLTKFNTVGARTFEGDYSDIEYWDSPNTIIFTPTPLMNKVRSRVEVVMDAYMGRMSQDKFDAIFDRSIKSIRERVEG
jgi:hypothetical protein